MMALLTEVSIRVVVIAACVGIALWAFSIRSGAARHAAWTAVLATMLAGPFLVWWGAALPEPLPRLPAVDRLAPVFAPGMFTAPPTRVAREQIDRGANLPATPREPLPAPPPVESRSLSSWSSLAMVVWLLGVAGALGYMVIGWRRAQSLLATAARVSHDQLPIALNTNVWQSDAIRVPVALGVTRADIILPSGWASWNRDDLVAVLVHEQAHVTRRDLAVSFIARLNQAVYWFHPLAWWLPRVMARASEEACDDEVVRRRNPGEQYAELLVQMASAVQQAEGRVRWGAAGIGGGHLESRIDRVLSGHAGRPLAWRRAMFFAGALFAAVVAGIGCQQQPASLRPNPSYDARTRARQERSAHLQGAEALTRAQVDALEAEVAASPDDLKNVERLLYFYRFGGQKMFGWNEMIARRRPHLLRVFERHPASTLAGRAMVRDHDPTGYEAAKAIWLRHVEPADTAPAVLGNAAEFFRASDKPMAESLLKRALVLDPAGPEPRVQGDVFYPSWRSRLGSLYAQAIVGATDDTLGNVVHSFSPDAARGAFALSARRTLETTTDVDLLSVAGQYLMDQARPVTGRLDFDQRALGRNYIDRAFVLAPNDIRIRRLKLRNDFQSRHDLAWQVAAEVRADRAAYTRLPEANRFRLGGDVATSLLMRAEGVEAKDPARQAQSTVVARDVATEALALSARYRDDPTFGTVVFQANMVLGQIALAAGDRRGAVAHLGAAVASPGSSELEFGLVNYGWRLPIYLLNVGELESVIAFYERMAELNLTARDRWLADAKAVRDGFMTESYQSTFGNQVAAAQ